MSTSIRIVTPEGGQYVVDYLPHDTLASLREKVSIFHSVSLSQRDVYCNGKRVPDNVKLQAIGISPQHVLTTSPNRALHISVNSQPPSPMGPSWSPNPALQISTAYSPHTSPQASPNHSTAAQPQRGTPRSPAAHLTQPLSTAQRARSGSMQHASPHNLSTPPPHPQPHSANDSKHGRRRSSLSLPPSADPFGHLPAQGPSPFDIVEQTLQKVEGSHPIDPTLYEKDASPRANGGFSRTSPVESTVSISTAVPRARSPTASPLARQPSPQPREPLTPSASTFQPVLSYRSKLTALSIALAELVDERMALDKKTDEEKAVIDATITEKKTSTEHALFEAEKHVALKARELDDAHAALARVQADADALRRRHEEKVRELEEKAEERRAEMGRVQAEVREEEERRKGVLEEVRSKVGEFMHVRDTVRSDGVREQEVLVRNVVDALVRAGVALTLVKKDIDGRG